MKHRVTLLLGLGWGLAWPVAGAQAAGVERLSWLAGCWAPSTAAAGSAEHWMAPAGGMLLGMSRTVRDGRTLEYEFMRVEEAPGGKLRYTALPSRQKEASFLELRSGDSDIVFENLEHDFPQRVIYRLVAPGQLQARIEGLRHGAPRGVDFPMTRVACEAR